MRTASHTSRRVLIVGGGISGLATAVRLAQSGLPVTVLEASRIGSGAATRNQGWLYSGGWFARQQPQLARLAPRPLGHVPINDDKATILPCIEGQALSRLRSSCGMLVERFPPGLPPFTCPARTVSSAEGCVPPRGTTLAGQAEPGLRARQGLYGECDHWINGMKASRLCCLSSVCPCPPFDLRV